MRIKRDILEDAISVVTGDIDFLEDLIANDEALDDELLDHKRLLRINKVLTAILSGEKVTVYD